MESGERVCDEDSSVWTEAVVVQDEMLKRNMRGEEGDQGRLGIESKCIIVQVDRVEFWQSEECSEEGGEGLWDFVQETSCKYICKVGDLERSVSVAK